MSEIFSLPAGSILTITARNQPAHIEMGENSAIGALIEAGETATYGPYVLDRTFVMTGDGVGSIEPATLGADDLGFGGDGGGDGGSPELPWAIYAEDGALTLHAGDENPGTYGGSVVLNTGNVSFGGSIAGEIALVAGAAGGGASKAGDIYLSPGAADGGAQRGYLVLENIPTSDPGVENAVWNDGGTLKISAG